MNILAIGAHFDDIELGCAGTLMKHADHGDKVTMLVVTDSEYTNYDGAMRRAKETALAEGRAAAEILGLNLVCGDFRTKTLTYGYQLIEFLNNWIDKLEIDLIYTHWNYDIHQDHSAIGRATINAGRHIPRILMYRSNWYQTTATFKGNLYVDVSEYIDQKIRAMKEHRSEYNLRGDVWIEFFKNINANYGQIIGVKYAECFEVVKYLL